MLRFGAQNKVKQAIPASIDRKTHKKCIKCREWRAKEDIMGPDGIVVEARAFGIHGSSEDGLQSICYRCKQQAGKEDRNRNVAAKLRHHVATRCLTQLGAAAPKGFTRALEDYLGYRIQSLVRHLREDLKAREGDHRKLRDALDEGYHVDHIRPLSSYPVVTMIAAVNADGELTSEFKVDWDMFRACWAIDNLSAIPGHENLAKGAKWAGDGDADEELPF